MRLQGQLPFEQDLIVTDPCALGASYEPIAPPRKRVRKVSIGTYRELRDSGRLRGRAAQVLRCLAAFFNRYQEWPTPAELTRYMFERGEIPAERANLVAPRLSVFINGDVRRHPDGSKRRVGGGVCEALPLRACRVTGDAAHPVRIREVGSGQS